MADPHVVKNACKRVGLLCKDDAAAQRAAAEAGVIEAAVAAMDTHHGEAAVQQVGCALINVVCRGTDANAGKLKKRVLKARAIEAAVKAIRDHPGVEAQGVHTNACNLLYNLCQNMEGEDREADAQECLDAARVADAKKVVDELVKKKLVAPSSEQSYLRERLVLILKGTPSGK